ncbi:MAG: hypothetical protein KA206_09980, partial [Paludibacter sp.]|nr:hypothetical protein [Paludibacter sp.]
SRVLGPVDPSVSRIQNLYIKQLILKIEVEASPAKAKELLEHASNEVLVDSRFRSVRISVDVDPV